MNVQLLVYVKVFEDFTLEFIMSISAYFCHMLSSRAFSLLHSMLMNIIREILLHYLFKVLLFYSQAAVFCCHRTALLKHTNVNY